MNPTQFKRKKLKAERRSRDPYAPIKDEVKLVCKAAGMRYGDLTLNIRRSKKYPDSCTGHAWWTTWRVALTIGVKCDRAQIAAIVCHELAHILARGDGHGDKWKGTFVDLAFETYGARVKGDLGNQFGLHDQIIEAIREVLQQ